MPRSLIVSLLAGCVLALAAIPGRAADAFDDEIVPEGVWKTRIALFREERNAAFDRFNNLRSLRRYLIPDRAALREIEGSISRTVTRTDFRFTYGLTDTWNLFLDVPYLYLEQDSSLETESADPAVRIEVESLRSQTLTGLGDFRLLSMHRPVFSDRNGFVWGYGLVHPVRDRAGSRPGTRSLALRSPNGSLAAFLHYTRYMTSVRRGRFDLRVEAQVGLDGRVKVLDGTKRKRKFDGGNTVDVWFAWHKEFGAVGAGFELSHHIKSQNRLGGAALHDSEEETLFRLRLGYGNLVELEQGPLLFPYQLMLTVDRSIEGFNIPYSDGITLSFQTYF